MNDFIQKLLNTEDTTNQYDAQDIETNKIFALFAYLGILILIPVFAAKDSKFAKYHINQGLTLIICGFVIEIVLGILIRIPVLGIIFGIIASLYGLVVLAMIVVGILNALNGKAKQLPIIGKFTLLK